MFFTQNGMLLEYASRDLRNDMVLAYHAVSKNPDAYKYVGYDLQLDKGLALIAVEGDGRVF